VTKRREPALVALALICLLAFAALAIAASLHAPAPWELSLLIAAEQPAGLGRDLILAVNTLGNLPVWAVVVVLIAGLVGATRPVVEERDRLLRRHAGVPRHER
jgi:hypothetical protein